MAEETHAFGPALLRGGGSLRAHGVEPTREPTWTQVRHGVWIPRSAWEALSPQARYAAFVHATASQCAEPAELVFSHWSAAVVLGLPRVDAWPRHADVLVPGPRVRSSRWVVKHAGRAVEPVTVLGVRVTPPARTVVDVARTAPLACAVAAADHALPLHVGRREPLTGPDVRAGPAASAATGRLPRRRRSHRLRRRRLERRCRGDGRQAEVRHTRWLVSCPGHRRAVARDEARGSDATALPSAGSMGLGDGHLRRSIPPQAGQRRLRASAPEHLA